MSVNYVSSALPANERIARRIVCATVLLQALIILTLQFPSSLRADVWVERMIDSKEHDFGTVEQGSDAVWRFPVTNVYKHKIVMAGVRSSCGCTTVSVEKNELNPSQTGYVVTKFNSRLAPGAHSARVTLKVSWNDGGVERTGEAAVNVSGTVRANVTVQPREITFTNVPHGTSDEQQLSVSAEDAPAWRLRSVRCGCENLHVKLPAPSQNAQQVSYEMPVCLSRGTPTGRISEQLVLVTNDDAAPQIPIRVTGRVVPELWTSEYMFVGEVAAGERISKKVLVRGTKEFRIVSVESNGEKLQFKSDEAPSTKHIVEIQLPTLRAGQSTALISIKSDTGHTAHVTALFTVANTSPH